VRGTEGFETLARMRAVAKRLVRRKAAAAQGNDGPSGESIGGAGSIVNSEVTFQPDRAVVVNGYFDGHVLDGSRSSGDVCVRRHQPEGQNVV